MKIVKFDHAGQEYEVRIISDGNTLYIRAFKDAKPANGYRYSVDLVTAMDIEHVIGYDAIKDLVESAKTDVIENRWAKYLEAVKSTKAVM